MSEQMEKPVPCPHCGELLTSVGVTKGNVLDWTEDGEEESFDDQNEAIEFARNNDGAAEARQNSEGEDEWVVVYKTGQWEDNGQGSQTYTCQKCGKQIGFHNENEESGIYVEE